MHQHGPGEHGHHAPTGRLAGTLALVGIYFLAELIGGWWTGSLALLADAGHMFADMASLAISLFAARMMRRRPEGQQTFGFYRAEILAALVNGALLFVVAGGILHEAWERFFEPQEILAGPMLLIALGGLVVNLISLSLLHSGRHENLNLRGAWLHVLGDTLGSVGVLVAAAMISVRGWLWADPAVSVFVCLLIVNSAWRLISDAARILMEIAPRDVDVERVRSLLLSRPEISDVHCLHVWTIASGLRALSAHLVIDSEKASADPLVSLQQQLRSEFRVEHVTLQLETSPSMQCRDTQNGACLFTHDSRPDSCEHPHQH